jgi:Peptidylarginine deiminase and related enzymes
MPKEIIYVAKPTWYIEDIYPGYTKFYEKFSVQLKEFHEVRALELPDIWVRDFLPMQNIKTGQLYQHFFNPRYANYTPKFTEQIRKAVFYSFPKAKLCNVRIDGGNIVLTPDGKYAFCLEKSTIFKKSDLAQKKHVEQELKNALGVEEILWLPKQPNDNIGHIDGYIQFLGNFLIEGTVELYNDLTSGSLLDSGGINKLYEYVKDKNIVDCLQEWIYLFCSDNDTDWLSAKGLYINFLETSKAVFVPQFNLPLDENAIKTLKLHTAKPIIKVDCSEIAKYGGAVHCLTKNYFL